MIKPGKGILETVPILTCALVKKGIFDPGIFFILLEILYQRRGDSETPGQNFQNRHERLWVMVGQIIDDLLGEDADDAIFKPGNSCGTRQTIY